MKQQFFKPIPEVLDFKEEPDSDRNLLNAWEYISISELKEIRSKSKDENRNRILDRVLKLKSECVSSYQT